MKLAQPKIFVQQIYVQWTKKSRGAPLATLRNSVPEAWEFSVDLPTLENHQLIVQFADFYEYLHFAPRIRFESFTTCDKIKYGCVNLQITQDQVDVIWHFNERDGGSPYRRVRRAKRAFTLQPKQWGRVLYNGRFAEDEEGGWVFHKTVINIGFFQSFESSVFRLTQPKYLRDETATLR